ncbi:MAG TPA: DUF4129 domain-containing protein [Longimicrobium sp.]
MPATLPSVAEVQKAVTTVYQRPEYRERHGIGEWLNQQLEKIWAWIGGQLERLTELRTTHPLLFWIIIGWLGISALALIAHLAWTALKVSQQGEREPGAARTKAPRARTAADWEAEAARLAAEGKLREAAAALYQALLLRLDDLGVVRFDASKTPGDYRREVRKHPDAARALNGFLRLFEPVAFGGRALDAEGWERMKGAAAKGAAHG